METGKPGLANAPAHISSVAAPAEKRMDIQAPLTAVYIHTVPALPAQPYPQPPAATPEPATLHLAVPPLYSKETLPFLTLHIAGGLQSQSGLSLAAAAPAARPKSAGKHVCPQCGRDCMKPSVLEKHLRCHTGERPYPCTTCGVSFKTQSNLYKHRRTQAHARLSSESEQSSLDSMSGSRETCTSSLSLEERSEESGSVEKDSALPAAQSSSPAGAAAACSVKTQSSVSEQNEQALAGQNTEANESEKVMRESEKFPLSVSRHLPLQRQEATLFSKQWESSVSRGKSQSHESTDSGFSETSDHYPSPGSVLPDHSMDSLAESTKEHLDEPASAHTPAETEHGRQESKESVRGQEQQTLVERISKLIKDNTAVVEDKQLENVRPRKTVLSKQGSIDLPMPYTYKDSFHFDMKIGQTQNFTSQRIKKPGLYSSVPTQGSSAMEHAPLTRSNSLPFSVTLLQPERSSPTSSSQSDYVTLVRRGSSGQINPTGFAIKPVNQQSSTHRPLVRQTAVDCNHATDGLFRNSSVEEACIGSLSCDGDGGDICGEPSNRKFRRKKAQKFAYNKWYMYGGGTFKKLYNAEKSSDNSVIKGRKCSINPEHEAVQGLPRRSPMAATTAGLTMNLTNSSSTAGPPAGLSLISAVDFHPQANQVNSSCTSLKAPLRRNLSSSVLPLPSIRSLISHKADCVSRPEAGRPMSEEKRTDFPSQLCGAHIPSDRKKLRTDDKIICPLQMETDLNTLITHPAPAVTQHDANLTYISLHNNPHHAQLKGPLFKPGIITANAPSVSASVATSVPSVVKSSFLPKYQLKLPNAAEPDLNSSPRAEEKPTGTEGPAFTSVLSSNSEQSVTSVTACVNNCTEPIASQPTCDAKETSAFSSTQDQLLSALCHSAASRLSQSSTCSLAAVHKQFAATTITTSCLHDYQPGLCSTLVQPLRCATSAQLPRPVAPAVAMLTVTTANNQAAAAAFKAVSHDRSYLRPPPSHTHFSAQSNVLNPVSRAHVGTNTPAVPCHAVPLDQAQPTAQNVFHVHTADLQICLQIISDEQLALIEPQIERLSGASLSQRRDMEAVTLEGAPGKAKGSVAEARDTEESRHQKAMNKSESFSALNSERTVTSLPVQFGKAEPNHQLAQQCNSTQVAASAECVPPETQGLSLHPHKYSHVNTVTESQSSAGDVMSSAAPHVGVKSGRRRTSEEEQALSLNCRAGEQLLLDGRVSQGGPASQTLSGQHKLSRSSLSSSTVKVNNLKSELLSKEGQHKLNNQGASCSAPTMKTEASAHKGSRLESEECLSQNPAAACSDKLPGSVPSFSINKCEGAGQPNPQASARCVNQVDFTTSETLNPSKDASVGGDRAGSLGDSKPLLEVTPCGSQDVISSGHGEKRHTTQLASVSSDIQLERHKDTPSACASVQSPTAGLMEGASLAGCAAQKEPQIWEHAGTPGQPDSTDWKQKQSQGAGGKNHQCFGERGGDGVMREEKNRGVKADKAPGLWGKAESDCRTTALPKPQGEDQTVKTDSFQNPWPPEEHPPHLSQTHSGMSEYPPLSPQQTLNTSSNLNIPASSSQTGLITSPQPPLEIIHFCHSQHSWENSIIHNQPAQVSLEPNSSQHINAGADLSQTHVLSRTEAFSASITLPVQRGTAAAGSSNTAVSCCKAYNSANHQNPDVGTSTHSNQVFQACGAAAAGSTGDIHPSKACRNAGSPSKPFTYLEPDEKQDTTECERADMANKYQSLFLSGPLHCYQDADCLNSGVRPVPSCQEYTEDTSSSDDEGKLIIEL